MLVYLFFCLCYMRFYSWMAFSLVTWRCIVTFRVLQLPWGSPTASPGLRWLWDVEKRCEDLQDPSFFSKSTHGSTTLKYHPVFLSVVHAQQSLAEQLLHGRLWDKQQDRNFLWKALWILVRRDWHNFTGNKWDSRLFIWSPYKVERTGRREKSHLCERRKDYRNKKNAI